MPPRKKAVNTASTATATAATGTADEEDSGTNGIGQYELPKSVIARLAKGAVPPEVKLQKEVPLALVKGSTVFINYLAALSHDLAQEKNTKTITAAHVLEAVKQLGWQDGGKSLEKELKKELKAFRKINEAKKAGIYVAPPTTAKSKSTRAATTTTTTTTTTTATGKTSSSKPKAVATSSSGGGTAERTEEENSTRAGTISLNDERPNEDEGDLLYPGRGEREEDEDMNDQEEEEDEEGVEVYQEEDEEEEDDGSDRAEEDDDGVEEPIGAAEGVQLDDVDDEED